MTTGSLVILVGPGRELGPELARKLGRNGYGIVLMGRHVESLGGLGRKLRDEGIEAHCIPADVTDPKSLDEAFAQIDKLEQPISGFIYNAVARRTKSPSALTAEEAEEDLKANLLGAIGCTSRLLRRYDGRAEGFILYTGGGVALTPSVVSASMSLGKAALRNYALNLAEELKSSEIYIGTVTITRKIERGTDYDPEKIADIYLKMVQEKTRPELVL